MPFADYIGTPFEPFILPIIPAGAPLSAGSKIAPESLGKIPGWRGPKGWYGFDWPRFRAQAKDLERFGSWHVDRPVETVGINSRELLGIDIDFNDADGARIVRDCAYEMLHLFAPVRTRFNSPKELLCYRLDFKNTTRRVTKIRRVFEDASGNRHAVEVLGDGQQWLMEGEHPSGVSYGWEHNQRPVDLGWDNIPAVTADQVDAFIRHTTERLSAVGFKLVKMSMNSLRGTLTKAFEVGTGHPDRCPDLELLKRALKVLPSDHTEFQDYDDWVKMLAALKTALGGDEEQYETFENWALPGHPDNTSELIRSKWESFTTSSLGWDYIGAIAGQYGFTEHLDFEVLPPLDDEDQPRTPTERPAPSGARRGPVPKLLPADFDLQKIPRRPFVLGTRFMAGAVTLGVGAPGAGKSYLAILSALAIATGQPLTDEVVHRSGRVWIHNNEESVDELQRRIGGILKYHSIDLSVVRENIFISSGLDERLIVATKGRDVVTRTSAVADVIAEIKANEISHIVVDPLVSTHRGVSENSNEEIEQVLDAFRQIAHETGCSIDLVHHSPKPQRGNSEANAGNMNAARGASSMIGAVRILYTLSAMSVQTAEEVDVHPGLAARLIRLDHAKGNYTARDPKIRWFELQSFNIGNGSSDGGDALFAEGDTIAVPIPWQRSETVAEQTKAEERMASRERRLLRVREIVAREMSSDQCRMAAVLPAIENEFSVKQSAARALANAAIPQGEEVLCKMGGITYSLAKQGEGPPRPSILVRKVVTPQAEAA